MLMLTEILSSKVFHQMLKQNQNGTDRLEYLTPRLYCLVRKLVIDHYRRQQYRNHISLRDEIIEPSHNTAEIVKIQITVEKVRMALTKLTPEQRQVIVLKFIEGFSNQEVADALSKPLGAVKVLQQRALVALKYLLDPIEGRLIE